MSKNFKSDELGTRIKENYENRTRIQLPRKTFTIIRLDGKAFHSFARGLVKPFDMGLIQDMDDTAIYLCKNIQGAKLGFVQSDEISILLTDFEELGTDAWFDGNIQKIVSVSASMATAKFNQLRWMRYVCERYNNTPEELNWTWFLDAAKLKLAEFDARTFSIPVKFEVQNYFQWRQQDTVRNSISSVAQSLYSHKELNCKNMSEQQELIFQKGINWNNYDPKLKRGRFIMKEVYQKEVLHHNDPEFNNENVLRTRWVSTECPMFSQDQDFLGDIIPDNN